MVVVTSALPAPQAGSGRHGELAVWGAAQPAAVFEPLEFRADVLALPSSDVHPGPLGGPCAGHRPAGLGRGRGDRLGQRPVVIWEVPVPDAWLRGGTSSPNPRCPGTGRLVSINGRSHQLRNDLPRYHRPSRFAFGIGELLAQQLDLTGQLGYPAGDPFRQPIPPPGILPCELGWIQTITGGYCQSSTDTTGKPTATSNDHQLRSAAPTSTSNPPTGPIPASLISNFRLERTHWLRPGIRD